MAEEFITVSNFKVTLDGHNWEVFESVSGLALDCEDIASNAQKNNRQITKRPGRVNARDITLVRRFKKDKEVYGWVKDIKDGKRTRKSGSVILSDDEDKEVKRFNFYESWPKSWSGPELSKDASGNDILRETVVLSVQDLEMA